MSAGRNDLIISNLSSSAPQWPPFIKKTYIGSIAYRNHEKTSMDDIVRRKEIQEAIAKIKDADIPLPAIFSDESHV